MVLLNLKVVVEIQILRAISTILLGIGAFQPMSSEIKVMEVHTAMQCLEHTWLNLLYIFRLTELQLPFKQSELY